METRFPSLFSPLKINHLILRNRIIAAPMGVPRAKLISSTYYGGISLEDKSKGGLAAIVVSSYGPADIAGEKDPFAKYARDVTRETLSLIEQDGAVGVMEFSFHPEKNADGTVQSPSDCMSYLGIPGKEMTREQMRNQIETLAEQCRKAKEFGFRMIMLHFGHDSQCSIFLSPVWNKRTDEYGGTAENRSRFAREALQAVRKAVGPNYPILMRVSRQLMVPETYSEDDMMVFLKSVEGLVDIVNVSGGMDCYGGTVEHYEANVHTHTTVFEPRYYNLAFAERVKKETNHVVCLVGGVSDPAICDQLIHDGKIDCVMMGRQLVADPFWANKAAEGREEDIVPCIRCLNCYHIATEHKDVECSVNPRFRRENRVPLHLKKTGNPKTVVVIGGGPAGMKAALIAAEKGHHVILLEKGNDLGGQLHWAHYDDYKSDLQSYLQYLQRQVKKSAIEVRLNCAADAQLVKSLHPDYIILAIGAEFIVPPIEGADTAEQAVQLYEEGLDHLDGKTIIIGGGTIGTELALELGERGKQVAIVEIGEELSAKENMLYKIALRQHLNRCKTIEYHLKSKAVHIEKHSVLIEDKDGNKITIAGERVVLAVGLRPNHKEMEQFYGITPHVAVIGDCKAVGNVIGATNDGYFVAANIE